MNEACRVLSLAAVFASLCACSSNSNGGPDAATGQDAATGHDAEAVDLGIIPVDAGTGTDASAPDTGVDGGGADAGFGEPLHCNAFASVGVSPLAGRIFGADSYPLTLAPIYDVTTGTTGSHQLFAQVPTRMQLGGLLITPQGRFLAVSDFNNGSIWDITQGGTFTSTRGLVADQLFPSSGFSNSDGLAVDGAGRIYVASSEAGRQPIAIVSSTIAGGGVHYLPGLYDNPESLIVCSHTLLITEGGTGRILAHDLNTHTSTTFATGFQTGPDHISAQLIVDKRGHIWVLWGNTHGHGLFDVSVAGDYSGQTPLVVTTFRTDVNQIAINSHGDMFVAGNNTGNLYVTRWDGAHYGPFTIFATGLGDTESVAIGP